VNLRRGEKGAKQGGKAKDRLPAQERGVAAAKKTFGETG
jgi:hypothetical protein